MGRSLADGFPECQQVFDEADQALGERLSDLIFNGPEDTLTLTENAQPALLTTSIAAYRLLVSRGIQPQQVAGHSLGEYSAHVAAGTMSFADAVRIVRQRGRYMQEAVPLGTGAMAAILGLDSRKVEQACVEAAEGEIVSPANLNAPGQVVIAGTASAVTRAIARAKTLGAKRAIPLQVSAPFHCALMKPAEERLAPELRALRTHRPRVPVIANVDGQPKLEAGSSIDALIQQVSAPVRWEDVMRRLIADGARIFIEVGPGKVLSRLTRKIASEVACTHIDSPKDLETIVALVAAHTVRDRA